MKNMKNVFTGVIAAFLGGFVALFVFTHYLNEPQIIEIEQQNTPTQLASISASAELPDLTFAAEKSVHAVVHIKTEYQSNPRYNSREDLLDFFFGDGYRRQQQPRVRRASGSGVIINKDGYIVTNNHVIKGADKIKVIMNDGRAFDAELVGRDSGTDIALLKIEADKELPYLTYGSSDNLKIGEWVLAVGNPFNLTSTVTAGIVSAKSRSIGIIRNPDQAGRLPIESFIQTDAAVNPGNSGGALVNMRGELVGINTAIASETGSYTGYSFAVPVSIVKKIVDDLKEFGVVQQGIMGIQMTDVTADLAKEYDIEKIEGVYIAKVMEDSGAEEAGMEKGDIVVKVNGAKVNSAAQLQEQVGKYRPGDKITVQAKRDGKLKQFEVTLRNRYGEAKIEKMTAEVLGAKIANIKNKARYNLGIRHGVKVVALNRGQFKDAGIKEGFVITAINKQTTRSINDVIQIIKDAKGGVLVEGIYPDGEPAYYVFSIKE